ncbi:MAG: hypothetical protein G8345_11245 [Magnetococcales bacterium]|nr:hypothetical protein [Magnetococcales bacterium]NGZ27448.1 hypothetical protein [Magnetococcales bacterium]
MSETLKNIRSLLENTPACQASIRLDWGLATLILLMGLGLGWNYLARSDVYQSFYQSEFAPAVLFACGRDFQNVVTDEVPELFAFLRRDRDRSRHQLPCHTLPEQIPVTEISGFQYTHHHLLFLAALTWKLAIVLGIHDGPDWSSLNPVFGLFYGLSGAFFFGLCRLAMGRFATIAIVLFFLFSQHHLLGLASFRDYAKIPFLIGILFIVADLLKNNYSFHIMVTRSLLAGTMMGIGVGMRQDILQLLPLIVLAILFFLPGPVKFLQRLTVLGIYVLFFVLVGYPTVSRLQGESNPSFNLSQGLTSDFSEMLEIEHSIYEDGYIFHDMYTYTRIKEFAERVEKVSLNTVIRSGLDFFSKNYTDVSKHYLSEMLFHYPADILLRFIASARKAAESGIIKKHGIFIVISAMAIIFWYNLRIGIFALMAFLFIGGMPGLLFVARHSGHVKFLALFCHGIVLQAFISWLFRNRAEEGKVSHPWIGYSWPRSSLSFSKILLYCLLPLTVFMLLISSTLWIVRWYQNNHLQSYLAHIASLPGEHLTGYFSESPTGRTWAYSLKLQSEKFDKSIANTYAEYLAITFSHEKNCQSVPLMIGLDYKGTSVLNFSRQMTLQLPMEPATYFHPIYRSSEIKPEIIEFPDQAASCIQELKKIKITDTITLLPIFMWPENPEKYDLYHTLWLGWSSYQPFPFMIKHKNNGFNVKQGDG